MITGAPLFLDGKIYIGVVGADYGTRGFLEAIDARTGDSVWRVYTIPGAGRARERDLAAERPCVPARRRLDLVDARVRRGPEPALRHDRQRRQRLVRRRPRGRQPLRRVDRRDRPRLRQAEVALPGGPPRHLGLRLAERAGAVRRREQRRHGEGDRRARARRAGCTCSTARPGAALRDRREAGAAERGTEDREDAADPAERRVHPAHAADREGDRAGEEPDHRRGEERCRSSSRRRCSRRRARKHMLIYKPGPQGGNNWEPSSYNQKTNMFYVCSAVQTVGRRGRPDLGVRRGEELRRHRRDRRHRLQRVVGHPDRDRRHRRQRRVAEDLARRVLQRHRLDGGQPRLRRSQRR